jgi:NAD(P)-dependent dehydrogenase (short-subunit alcohol dehydrogenase family)
LPLPLQSVVTREITLFGSCASRGEYPEAIALMAVGAIDVAPLITAGRAARRREPRGSNGLHRGEGGLLKVVLTPYVGGARFVFDLRGKNAVVHGASGGWGGRCAGAARGGGGRRGGTSRDRDALRETCDEIEALGRRAVPLALDVRNQRSIHAHGRRSPGGVRTGAHPRQQRRLQRPQAGLDVTWDDWNLVLDTNLRGPFFVAQAFASGMIAAPLRPHRQHRLGDVGSSAMRGSARTAPAAAGIRQLTMSLADDWGPHGMTVNLPGAGLVPAPRRNQVLYEDESWVSLPDRFGIPLKAARPAPRSRRRAALPRIGRQRLHHRQTTCSWTAASPPARPAPYPGATKARAAGATIRRTPCNSRPPRASRLVRRTRCPQPARNRRAADSHDFHDPLAGFAELYERHYEAVFRAALRVTGNPADAEDVLQTVFLRVLARGGDVEDVRCRPPTSGAQPSTRPSTCCAAGSFTRSRLTTIGAARRRPAPLLLKERLRAQSPPWTARTQAVPAASRRGLSNEELARDVQDRETTSPSGCTGSELAAAELRTLSG